MPAGPLFAWVSSGRLCVGSVKSRDLKEYELHPDPKANEN
jgi:hypothetical protein